ncbi:SPX-domain-containing protein [Annulohypoxylon truncatum]|uniref:SPX-domain-containing protein n=1 Tax=Annulohypoxylon truncatum TaxID=327061 RepID=UPI0020080C07|nr:SPX-domain-containing protein [Annulohypoxylon truncatum]KAI1206522.1 SPX-domain-containing protein [Annulohypoxylon truncatum]
MKFSHSIQFNAVPDWSSHYIAYSNLKKLIYGLEKTIHQPGVSDVETRPLLRNEDPEVVFARALDVELEKISSFYGVKEKELFDEVDDLMRDIGSLDADGQVQTDVPQRPALQDIISDPVKPTRGPRSAQSARSTRSTDDGVEDSDEDDDDDQDETSALNRRKRRRSSLGTYSRRRGVPSAMFASTDMTASTDLTRSRRYSLGYDDYAETAMHSSGIMLKKRIISLYVQLCELKSYVQLNKTGFSKVLKKFDKIIDREFRPIYMKNTVEITYPFLPETIRQVEESIAKMEKAYADVVTHGDEPLAKKDLRSHLREHVVWERNTVWRELIGLERRAEAASLGKGLLGGQNDGIKVRLQGDDAPATPMKEIETPIGRFTCPTWLFGSTMFTLLGIIAIFLVLLYVPIMDRPEQQNCLAMLVFVSLLWATEAIPLFVTSLLIPFLCVVLQVVREDDVPYKRLDSKNATPYVFAAMWTPVIMLLLGGFTVAAALSKCKIDKRIATFVLSKAGTQPRTVLIATMFVAAFASMLVSNVAAPVLCFSIVEPMLRNLPSGSNMSKAVIMGIALASNIGGMLSPIASPQNVVALGIMEPAPTWGEWFFVVIPVGIISILLIWVLLLVTFQPGKGTTIVPIRPVKEPFTGLQWFVSFICIATIGLWCASHQLESTFGDMGVIAIIPIVLFFGVGILTKEDFNNFPWTIIILAAGGLALGKAVKSSGLLHTVAEGISREVNGVDLYGILIIFSSLTLVIATFISHTVAALIILPLVSDIGKDMEEPHPNLLVMAAALMCSAAMALPTSGFPNMTRPIIELKQRDKSKIETILAHGDRVLVGLNTGSLRIYRLNELTQPSEPPASNGTPSTPPSTDTNTTPSSSPKPTDLLREIEKFSTRAIEQLAIIREANIIVSLSNYNVSLHDLQTYELIETISRTRNATCFAVTSNIVKDAATGIPEIISRLAVAIKRRLLLWSWHESELHDEVTEIVLPEGIRTLTWANATKVVCGMNAGYVLVDVTTSETHEIVGLGAAATGGQGSRFGAASMGYMGLGGYMPKPLATRLAEGQMLLAKDINSLFIDTNGNPLEKRQVPWQNAPESIGYSYPYILILQPPAKGTLDVRNPETLSLLQTIELPGAAQMHFPPPTVSLAHAGKGFHISSDRAVWKMEATDYDTQVKELIDSAKYDEAVSVLGMLEDALLKDKTGTMREAKMLKAEVLFKKKKFSESLALFNEDEVHAPPQRVLRLYPRTIAGDLSAECTREESASEEEDQEEDEKVNGDKPAKTESNVEVASPSRPSTFAKYWMGHRKGDSDAASITSSKKGGTDSEDMASVKAKTKKKKAEEDGPLEGKDLIKAVRELNSYLAGTRTRLQRWIDPATGKLKPRKPTTGKGSSISLDENLDALLTNSRSDSDEQLEHELKETFTMVDTALFRGLMFVTPTLAGSLFRIPNFCDPAVVNEHLLKHSRYNELVDFFYGKKLHRDALTLLRKFGDVNPEGESTKLDLNGQADSEVTIPEQLRGPRRTVGYLQSLPPEMIDIILEFADWVLRRDPNQGMEVFLADSENAETLPRERVVRYLGAIDVNLEIRYLQHIITELEDGTPDFHNQLVELLVQALRDDKRDESWNEKLDSLVTFLRGSQQYSLSRALSIIPRDDPAFYEARAIVFSNMGSHKQALEIYVFNMQDYAKAEEYCNHIHALPSSRRESFAALLADEDDRDPDSKPSIYHMLLSLYLTPPPPNKPNLEPALSLLSRHGSRLPAESTLSLIPDDLPVTELESYFRGRIRAANSVISESRIVEGLRKTQLVNTQALLLLGDGIPGGQSGRSRKVVIGEERVCGVCHKRLGNSVVAVLPDNTVVHYGCLGRPGRSMSGTRSERIAGSWGRHG